MSSAVVPQTARGSQHVTLSYVVSRTQRGQELSGMEVKLVRYLAGHEGRFVAQWELRDHLYAGIGADTAVRELVRRVRAKLGASFIERGELGGYRLSSQRTAELERRCALCHRPVVAYGDEWVCYGCPSTQFVDMEVGRADGAGERSGQPWTDDERAFVMAHLDDMTLEEIGAGLGRSESAVRGLLAGLGVRKTYVRAAR